ncbi:MAG: hypothetical protein NC084_02300 [Bacteroides sp.]|nr:hypothetical protein [Bacteroides sp.]
MGEKNRFNPSTVLSTGFPVENVENREFFGGEKRNFVENLVECVKIPLFGAVFSVGSSIRF